MVALAAIEVKYGYVAVDTLQKAYADGTIDCPSYKTFERQMGGMRTIATVDFRKKLKPYIEKARKSAENNEK